MGYVWRDNTLPREKRDGIDILASLLEGATLPKNSFTRIVFHMNISYDRALFYLKFALEKGLIREEQIEKRTKIYRITTKGLKFLSIYQMLRNLLLMQ